MNVSLTDSSKLDIRIISENLNAFNGSGDEFTRGIFDRMDMLKENPLLGSSLQSKIDIETDYRFLVYTFTKKLNYIIIYRLNHDRTVGYINRIFDGQEDYLRVLFGNDVD